MFSFLDGQYRRVAWFFLYETDKQRLIPLTPLSPITIKNNNNIRSMGLETLIFLSVPPRDLTQLEVKFPNNHTNKV